MHNADLEWFFRDCESEMGMHSSFGSFITVAKLGGKRARLDDGGELVNGLQEDLASEDALIDALDARRERERMGAAHRNRRILAAYRQLQVHHQRVLEAAYAARQWPAQALEAFGSVAGVVAFTATAKAIPPAARADWLAQAMARGDVLVGQMRAEAEVLFREAREAYERAAAGLA